jgi:nitrate/TMAO reductase-like tetraheme cytochrome c subunit
MALGKIDRTLPFVKTNALNALTRTYKTDEEAFRGIATTLAEKYPADKFAACQPGVRSTISAIQEIYRDNFFPEMKASWQVYPDNIGHKDWPGCFRCHDGKHKTSDGKRLIKANDCNACHTILAQGTGKELELLTPQGQKFKHPGDEVDGACNDCHNGSGL